MSYQGQKYESENREKFIKEWHYVYRANGLVENNTWKYDLEYDESKYRYEHILQIVQKAQIDATIHDGMIKMYTEELNQKYKEIAEKYWIYDREKMEFIENK